MTAPRELSRDNYPHDGRAEPRLHATAENSLVLIAKFKALQMTGTLSVNP